jgi:hypothetical protein
MQRSSGWLLAGLGFIAPLSIPMWAQQAPPPSYGTPQYGQPPAQYGQPPAQYGQPPAQYGQQPPAQYGQPAQAQAPLLSPDQLDNLVAPVALYPDPLLSEILAASTYPLEIVDAEQWLQQNRNLPAAQRMDAAKQQSWDPSVQALVAFPDVLDILGRDVRWTTDLGNAFLAQQADVMNAIQNMRARAQQSGRLRSTPQQTVQTQTENGQSAIQIAPADPQMIYPPVYDPYAVWGPPAYGAYPSLWYPPAWLGILGGLRGLVGLAGIGFGPGIFLGGLFAGLLGFGGWGWGLSWLSHALFLNPLFLGHFGFHGFGGGYGGGFERGGLAARAAWVHDPGHRLGVPYGSREVAARFGGAARGFGSSAGARAEISRSEVARSEVGRSEVGRSEVGRSEVGRSEVGRSEVGRSEAGRGVGGSGFRSPSTNQFAARATPQGNRGAEGFNSGSYNRAGPAQGYRAPAQSFAAPRAQESNRSQSFGRSEGNRGQQQARQPQSTARNYSAPHASSSHGSSSHGSSHGGGHSGGHSSGHKG